MIRTVPYDAKYDRELELLDRDTFLELKYHGDVIYESATAAVRLTDHTDRLAGVGYLLAPSGLSFDEHSSGSFFLHGIFRGFGEDEAEASILLLDALKEHFLIRVSAHPEKKLCLRLWCRSTDTAYMELLKDMGFLACDTMYVMKKDLSVSEGMEPSSVFRKASENGLKLLIARPEPREEFLREYCIANEKAFKQPCSLNDLRFIYHFCEKFKQIFPRYIPIVNEIEIPGVNVGDIINFEGETLLSLALKLKIIQIIRRNAVLHKLGNKRLDLIYITALVRPRSKYIQLILILF